MADLNQEELRRALQAAGAAHHDYEVNTLGGERDKQWDGWYAAYVLGRLGDFVSPSALTQWLGETPAADDWFDEASKLVVDRMKDGTTI